MIHYKFDFFCGAGGGGNYFFTWRTRHNVVMKLKKGSKEKFIKAAKEVVKDIQEEDLSCT